MLKGTSMLTKLIFRQQRVKILIWLLGLLIVTLAVAVAYPDIYPDEQSRHAFALTMQNPAMIAMLGLGYAVEDYSAIGALFAHEMLLFTAIAVAIMNILLVIRSTRSDEEDGRTEMIRSLPVGRISYLNATMIVIIVINVLLAFFTGIGIFALGIEGMNFESSILYGAILGVTGLVFAGLTAVFAQLAETSRGTFMLAFGALIGAYLVRAIGDVSNGTFSLFSPLGWTVRTEVFVENNWWPVYLSLAAAIVISFVAFYLNSIRDIEAGFIPAKVGRKHASSFLRTPFGFILRQQRTNIIAWVVIVFIFSASFGYILGDLETYFSDLEFMEASLAETPGSTMTDQFIALVISIMSLISTVPAVMTILHLKGEEDKNRTENFYSRSVSRANLLGNYFLIAIVVSFIMQSLVAVGLWSVGATVMNDALQFGTMFASTLVYLPAMWIVIGLAVLFIGLIPKVTGFVWFYLIYAFVVLYLGALLEFPEWLNNLSAFEHVPQILVEDMELMKVLTMVIIVLVLVIIGFIGYNKRDIEKK